MLVPDALVRHESIESGRIFFVPGVAEFGVEDLPTSFLRLSSPTLGKALPGIPDHVANDTEEVGLDRRHLRLVIRESLHPVLRIELRDRVLGPAIAEVPELVPDPSFHPRQQRPQDPIQCRLVPVPERLDSFLYIHPKSPLRLETRSN